MDILQKIDLSFSPRCTLCDQALEDVKPAHAMQCPFSREFWPCEAKRWSGLEPTNQDTVREWCYLTICPGVKHREMAVMVILEMKNLRLEKNARTFDRKSVTLQQVYMWPCTDWCCGRWPKER